jgi:hypothetical protein
MWTANPLSQLTRSSVAPIAQQQQQQQQGAQLETNLARRGRTRRVWCASCRSAFMFASKGAIAAIVSRGPDGVTCVALVRVTRGFAFGYEGSGCCCSGQCHVALQIFVYELCSLKWIVAHPISHDNYADCVVLSQRHRRTCSCLEGYSGPCGRSTRLWTCYSCR